MGPAQSSTKSSVEIANSFVSNVALGVVTKNSTAVSGDQSINISCTDAAFAAATAACSADTQNRDEAVNRLAAINPTLASQLIAANIASQPESCTMCSAEDITMDMNVSVNTSAIADNTIANQIKSELTAKLQDSIDNSAKGGTFTGAESNVEASVKLKNYVETNFDTKIVNETLNTYAFKQSITAQNARLKNINMKLVATALGSSMVSNAIKNDSSVAGLIDAATTIKASASGGSLLGDWSDTIQTIAIVMGAIIGLVIGIKLLMMFGSGGGSPQYMPPPQQQYMQPPSQQQYMPQLPPQYMPQMQPQQYTTPQYI